ncbi:MAG: HK97 family phage prohead protease [Acidobacteria bacterium]|nr:HK97 family phage prohead protease [Acidobacteriota bacterium]
MRDADYGLSMTRCGFVPEVKAIDPNRQRVTHVISSASVDRAGDIIEPGGWKLGTYRKNPVVLLDHDYRVERIIGKAVDLDHDDENLYATTEFGSHPLGVEAFLLVEMGLARGWSVGFRAEKYHSIVDGKGETLNCCRCKAARTKTPGFHYTQAELLEYSLVAIPMNPDAVTNAIQRGVSPAHIPLLFRVGPASSCDARDGAKTSAATRLLRDQLRLIARAARGQYAQARAERHHGE